MLRLFVPLVLLLSLSAACALSSQRGRVQLSVNVAPDANEDRPIPVDLVVVWDKDKAAEFGELTAKDWFARKSQFRRDDPQERMFIVREWEWVPAQEVPTIDLALRASAWRRIRSMFVFANYRSEGPHRLRITPGTVATLELLRDVIRLQPIDAPRQPAQ